MKTNIFLTILITLLTANIFGYNVPENATKSVITEKYGLKARLIKNRVKYNAKILFKNNIFNPDEDTVKVIFPKDYEIAVSPDDWSRINKKHTRYIYKLKNKIEKITVVYTTKKNYLKINYFSNNRNKNIIKRTYVLVEKKDGSILYNSYYIDGNKLKIRGGGGEPINVDTTSKLSYRTDDTPLWDIITYGRDGFLKLVETGDPYYYDFNNSSFYNEIEPDDEDYYLYLRSKTYYFCKKVENWIWFQNNTEFKFCDNYEIIRDDNKIKLLDFSIKLFKNGYIQKVKLYVNPEFYKLFYHPTYPKAYSFVLFFVPFHEDGDFQLFNPFPGHTDSDGIYINDENQIYKKCVSDPIAKGNPSKDIYISHYDKNTGVVSLTKIQKYNLKDMDDLPSIKEEYLKIREELKTTSKANVISVILGDAMNYGDDGEYRRVKGTAYISKFVLSNSNISYSDTELDDTITE